MSITLKRYYHRILHLSKLGDSFFDQLNIACLLVSFTIFRLIFKKSSLKKSKKIRLAWHGKVFNFFISNQLDFDILMDTFINEEYLLDIDVSPKIIFDLGSNIGATLLYFKIKYPESKIFAFEPDPENINILKINCSKLSNVSVFERAVWYNNDEILNFNKTPGRHWSSSLLDRVESSVQIQIKTISLDKVITENSISVIDILKFDIEGAEFEVFKNFSNLDKVNYLIGEIHTGLFNKSVEDFVSLFPEFDLLWHKGNVLALKNKHL